MRSYRRKELGDMSDPQGFPATVKAFLDALLVRNYSVETIHTWRKQLIPFIEWCAERDLRRPSEVTRPILERYQRHLHEYRKPNGEPLRASSQLVRLQAVKRYFHWLTKQNRILFNPASELELPRVGFQLPKDVLTAEEAEKLMGQPDLSEPLGLRDRAMLEIF
jgi:integrase/recombinase XerD